MEELITTTDDMERMNVAKALNLTDLDEIRDNEQHLTRLIEYAKGNGATDKITLLAEIAALRNRLGTPTIGEMAAWIYLENERKGIETRKQALEAEENKVNDTLRKFEKRDGKGRFL